MGNEESHQSCLVKRDSSLRFTRGQNDKKRSSCFFVGKNARFSINNHLKAFLVNEEVSDVASKDVPGPPGL